MEKACTNTAEAIIGKLGRQLHLVVYSYDFGLLSMIFLNSDFFSRPELGSWHPGKIGMERATTDVYEPIIIILKIMVRSTTKRPGKDGLIRYYYICLAS